MKSLLLSLVILLSFSALAQPPAYVPTDSLVGWWGFNGNANDETSNGNDGTVSGAVLTSDRFGGADSAYFFNAAGNVINLPEIDPSIGTPGNSTSYSMWFKGEPASGFAVGVILGAYDLNNFGQYQIRFEVSRDIGPFNNGLRTKVYYRCPAENNEPVNPVIYDESIWHNIIVTVDGNSGAYNYYFDGVLDANMSFVFNPVENYYTAPRTWQIGTVDPQPNSVSHQFYGSIDDIGIWNRVLTDCEIEEIYSSQETIENSVIQNGATLTADQSGATYQWLDCDNNYAVINGETNQSYTPSNVTGNYAVEVTLNACVDTSACYHVDYTGIEELINTKKELIKIIDFMGRETEFKPNTPLIFIYSDGTRKRVMEIQE